MFDEPLHRATAAALHHLRGLADRPAAPTTDEPRLRAAFGGPLPEHGDDPAAVVDALALAAAPGLVTSPGPRYFGFVTGGALPAALAADWLTSTWDQNSALAVMSPAAAACEEAVAAWLLDLLGLPATAGLGLVTGGQMANTTCLSVAVETVLRRAGHDPVAAGLAGCPPVTIVVGAEAHATIWRALRFLGVGTAQVCTVPVDAQGRMRVDLLGGVLDRIDGPFVACAQAGNVNSGAFDPLAEIADAVHARGGWLHVDGAFGLWVAATERRCHLTKGHALADSWGIDLHKWLNVPYDSGAAVVADRVAMNESLRMAAPYLVAGDALRDNSSFSHEASRRARAFAAWAALRSLGRSGMASMIDRCCDLAARFAERLSEHPRLEVLNDVVINQVMVRLDDDDAATSRLIGAMQAEGTMWAGPTVWKGMTAMRISVSNWATTVQDIDASAAAIERLLTSAV